MKQIKRTPPFEKVIRLMRHQKSALSEAGAAQSVLDAYEAVLRHLSTLGDVEIKNLLSVGYPKKAPPDELQQPSDPVHLTLDEVEAMLRDETTSRKQLEAVAVRRFDVPKGSMRSFSNMTALREKLHILIRNERAHRTISEVASRSRI